MPMRLADFILANVEPILQGWEAFARSLAPGDKMDVLALGDDAEVILRACVRTCARRKPVRSRPVNPKATAARAGGGSDRLDDASAVHSIGRVASGFNLNEVVSEYPVLFAPPYSDSGAKACPSPI